MQMIPNTGIVVLNKLETAYEEARAYYTQFEAWYCTMSNERGGVDLNANPVDYSHLARSCSYLSYRCTVELAVPEMRRLVDELNPYLETIAEMFETEEDPFKKRYLKVNYIVAWTFIHRANILIAKAQEHLGRSSSIKGQLTQSLNMIVSMKTLHDDEGAAVVTRLEKYLR